MRSQPIERRLRVRRAHRALGHDAPLAVTAMGGRLAIEDNREILYTLEKLRPVLRVFSTSQPSER